MNLELCVGELVPERVVGVAVTCAKCFHASQDIGTTRCEACGAELPQNGTAAASELARLAAEVSMANGLQDPTTPNEYVLNVSAPPVLSGITTLPTPTSLKRNTPQTKQSQKRRPNSPRRSRRKGTTFGPGNSRDMLIVWVIVGVAILSLLVVTVAMVHSL